jgi:hypothetical protein
MFACRAVSGEPTPDGVETDRAAYFSFDEIQSCPEPFESWCKWLALRVLSGKCQIIPEKRKPLMPLAKHFCSFVKSPSLRRTI